MDEQKAPTVSLRQLLELKFPENHYIVNEGLLPPNGLMIIGGPPKSYKSFIMNTIVSHLATGTNLFGATRSSGGHTSLAFNVNEPQRVLLFEQEIGFCSMQERLRNMMPALQPHHAEMAMDNIFIHSEDSDLKLDSVEGCKAIGAIIEEVKPTVVCFDPLIEFHSSDENSTQQMATVLQNLTKLRQAYKFATIISHHTGKPSAENRREGPDLLRGNSVVFGKGDSFIMLSPSNRSSAIVRLDFTIRRAKPIASFNIRLDWEELRAKFDGWKTGRHSGDTDNREKPQKVTYQ
jgi:RecA-family ATPase